MAHEHERRLRSPSPAGSGRDSPLTGFRGPRRQLEDESLKQDKPYRRWATQVERTLALFEASRLEWPDYISALGRLLKTIQTHPPDVDTIPHRHGVANKLAQCLDPSLPSGVHQKALELYDYIFAILRRDGLARDLPVFLPGLSPVLSFASLSIRPVFLTLLEKHVIHLDAAALRPALRALLLCLLPGLEEENSEDFDRTFKIVDSVRDAVNTNPAKDHGNAQGFGDEYFWQCLFLSAISGISRRQGSLSFLVRRLPKLGPAKPPPRTEATNGETADDDSAQEDELPPAAEAVVSPEPGLLIRCFAAGLEDEQPLIQRSYLDLLLSHLPLHSPVFTTRVDDQDLERLVTAASAVLARRDMSLNRRLWSWFLGPNRGDDGGDIMSPTTPMLLDRKNNKNMQYFKRYALNPLTASILRNIHRSRPRLTDIVRSFRISLSLLDRWEIGTPLIPRIFIPSLRSLMRYRDIATSNDYQEALRSAGSFFDGIEAGLIWAQMIQLLGSALGSEPLSAEARQEKLDLASFIIQAFNVRDEEMIVFHIPLCCVYTLTLIVRLLSQDGSNSLHADENITQSAVQFADELVQCMPERGQLNKSFGQDADDASMGDDPDSNRRALDLISSFYEESSGDLSNSPPPFSSQHMAEMLLRSSSHLLTETLQGNSCAAILAKRARLVGALIVKTPDCRGLDVESLIQRLKHTLSTRRASSDSFITTATTSKLLVTMSAKLPNTERRAIRSSGIVASLVQLLWSYLTPAMPKFHVESVRLLWQLDTAEADQSVLESSVSRFVSLSTSDVDDDAEAARRFAVLWTHSANISAGAQKRGSVARRSSITASASVNFETRDHQSILIRPLLLCLEGLNEDGSELYFFLVSWLKSSGILFTVFDVLLVQLAALEQHQRHRTGLADRGDAYRTRYAHSDKTHECCYYLKHVANLLRLPLENIGIVLSTQGTPLPNASHESDETLQGNAINLCLDLIDTAFADTSSHSSRINAELQCQALSIMQQLFGLNDQPGVELATLEQRLLDMLGRCIKTSSAYSSAQVALLDTMMGYLKSKYMQQPRRSLHHRKVSSMESPSHQSLRRSSIDRNNESSSVGRKIPPPEQLLRRLQDGIVSTKSRSVLENWVLFLVEVLPLYAHSLFQNLIPLVETFCKQISLNFRQLQESFAASGGPSSVMTETSLMSLLNGLENTLSVAHDRLAFEENASPSAKPPEPSQSFFGNVVSGVLSTESPKGRQQSSANSRLTVILCLQDAVRICYSIWAWAAYGHEDDSFDNTSAASFSYSSSRLRNRARRLLDRMFIAETLECLETLIALRSASSSQETKGVRSDSSKVISVLHALDGSRPKRLMPTIFNSLYSRTNPNALEPGRMSSLTSEVKDTTLGVFLVDYTRSLDDDAMDEIWTDCMTFLKDVLSNPLIHSSILPCLLLFLLTLAEKVEKTNFGEQRKMRKELSDLFQRLLQATFTSRPAGILHDPGDGTGTPQGLSVIEILATIMPKLPSILPENPQQVTAVTLISTNVFGSLIHAKQFPDNVTQAHLTLLQKLVRISPAAKVWRKDIGEIYAHPKLFALSVNMVSSGLLPILRQWGLVEKERIPDTLNRIPAPTTAGIMFGVGANAARLEADKKSQLNLRRATTLALAMDTDALVPHLPTILEKSTELFNASSTSSPSSATRAEVFMLIQAVILKTSAIHLSALWSPITAELQKAISSVTADNKDQDTYNAVSLLQACRLLDLLLLVGPDDFQMHAWLFITDTIDAVYRPPDSTSQPAALVDEIAEELNAQGQPITPGPSTTPATPFFERSPSFGGGYFGKGEGEDESPRRSGNGLLLKATSAQVKDMSRDDLIRKVLRPWFAQLSLQCFEREYSMRGVDWEGLREGLIRELFEEGTIVS